MSKIELIHGDCLVEMKKIPDGSVNLVLTDPPYNIKKEVWDNIEGYAQWSKEWLSEAKRVVKENGYVVFWHNSMPLIADLIKICKDELGLAFNSFGVWEKKNFRTIAWKNTNNGCVLRSWFNLTEMFFVFVKHKKIGEWEKTGLQCVYDNPECFKPLKDWYRSELARLGLTKADLALAYKNATGKKNCHMLRHWFSDSQFEIPTRAAWDAVFVPLGFGKSYEELRKEYEELRKEYEKLRKEYEKLRPTFNINQKETYGNIFASSERNDSKMHPCKKPCDILERIILAHTNKGETVLDCFMGSGSTGVACMNTGRNFIGIEKDRHYFDIATARIAAAEREADK